MPDGVGLRAAILESLACAWPCVSGLLDSWRRTGWLTVGSAREGPRVSSERRDPLCGTIAKWSSQETEFSGPPVLGAQPRDRLRPCEAAGELVSTALLCGGTLLPLSCHQGRASGLHGAPLLSKHLGPRPGADVTAFLSPLSPGRAHSTSRGPRPPTPSLEPHGHQGEEDGSPGQA